jgi:regulator of sirC expression with transglutaminase-like and TPR domain
MATPTTVYINPNQRKRLFQRARRRKTSFSEELRAALDFYLDLPPDFDEKALAALVREANASMDRSIAKLDETLTFLEKFREGKA